MKSSVVVAARIIESTEGAKLNPESSPEYNAEPVVITDKLTRTEVDYQRRRGKYSYYMKNCIVYIISAILQYSVANGTLNLLTSFAGEEKGFATLVRRRVCFLIPGNTCIIKSLGCKPV